MFKEAERWQSFRLVVNSYPAYILTPIGISVGLIKMKQVFDFASFPSVQVEQQG